ncbi:MAG: CDP-diacylglycerol--glycerol-3-phosphate 3-phosphatidyltransferase [Geminicoccaceae bacterium]|nr:CDP-diacylglycerol--glycerol-3-phosphate 3-phosphatidyltransferase [Geminicoccaceae bacterium]MCB2012547.1 CDP-diacylglycerol--glycerol-3-phosphate 3-phosphatidyltransferase [Geminicoccaceae bacterium]MCB9943438.1 CDP-diacylglycerol--glycerol-3-phosphate 3-phosphatidyltransferase [Geminicoccaceae bacterium]
MRMLPNLLSLGRIFCGPLVIMLLALQSQTALAFTIVVMLISEASDLADGHIARRYSATSSFGKIVDPLADSLYRAMVFLAFLDAGWMPLWMVAIIVSRDILVSYLRIFSQQNGITLSARMSGKIKAVVQGVIQIATVMAFFIFGLHPEAWVSSLVYAGLLIATLVTAWSAVDYTIGFLRSVDIRDTVANKG